MGHKAWKAARNSVVGTVLPRDTLHGRRHCNPGRSTMGRRRVQPRWKIKRECGDAFGIHRTVLTYRSSDHVQPQIGVARAEGDIDVHCAVQKNGIDHLILRTLQFRVPTVRGRSWPASKGIRPGDHWCTHFAPVDL